MKFEGMKFNVMWRKPSKIDIFGQTFDIELVADCYGKEPINEAQEKAYGEFVQNSDKIIKDIENCAMNFVNENFDELEPYWDCATKISDARELAHFVTPKQLYFDTDGSGFVLFDADWDIEHGFAVRFTPSMLAGTIDILYS